MKVTGSDVDALFRGDAIAPKRSRSSSDPVERYDPRPARCNNCRQRELGLWTFTGDRDFDAWIPVDSPLRVEVDRLRKAFGKNMILLCDLCVAELRGDEKGADGKG